MRIVQLPALIAAAISLAASLTVAAAVAQTPAPIPVSLSLYLQVLGDARTTFSVPPLQGDIELSFGAVRNGRRVLPSDVATLASFQGVTFHRGVDYAAAEGLPIVAPGPGRVTRIELNSPDAGRWLEIDHGQGLLTRYTHLSAVDVSVGDNVMAGQEIARVGHSGAVRDATHSHLHFEVLSMRVHPGSEYFIDPELVLPAHREH